MSGSPQFTAEEEARIREIAHEERLAFRKSLPALAVDYPAPSARRAQRDGGLMLGASLIASLALLLMLGWRLACTR